MVKHLIKKSFFVGWDNLIPQFLYNIVCMGLIALFLFIYGRVADESIAYLLLIIAGFLFLFCIFLFGLGGVTHNWSIYQGSWNKGFVTAIKNNVVQILLFYMTTLFVMLNIIVLIPYYLNTFSYIGAFIAFVQIWVCLFLIVAMQYYIPLCMFLDGEKPFFIFSQCFVLFFENKVFSFSVFLKTIVDFLISALSFFFIPGMSFISLSHMNAVNLLHLSYRWAKDNNIQRKDINVYDMLEEERKNLGKRTLRTMFRPWKMEK